MFKTTPTGGGEWQPETGFTDHSLFCWATAWAAPKSSAASSVVDDSFRFIMFKIFLQKYETYLKSPNAVL
jgi:hypothetical protein